MNKKNVLYVKNLNKIYSKNSSNSIQAINNLNLEVKEGEIFGLLGPNGAGKSTFINILAGTTIKTSGEVNVWGFNLDKNPRQVRAVHKPPIIILDEPTAGVDVELRSNLWDNVKQLNKNGVTIILTTHYLHEAEEMCDRIGILNKGNLVALDTTKNLLKKIQTKIVKFLIDKKVIIDNSSLKSINVLSSETNELTVSYEKNTLNISEIINFINDQNIKIFDISTDDGDLEDVFIRLTKN